MAIIILIGAGVLGWNQAVGLPTRVSAVSAIFLDILLVGNIFGTLRSAQTGAVLQAVVQGAVSLFTVICLWKIHPSGGVIYQSVLLGTAFAGIQIMMILTGKNAEIDDGFFDESTSWKFGQQSKTNSRADRREHASWEQ